MHLIWNSKSIGCLWWQHWENHLKKTPVFSSDVVMTIIKHSPLFYHNNKWYISDDNGAVHVDGIEHMFKEKWFDCHIDDYETNWDIM